MPVCLTRPQRKGQAGMADLADGYIRFEDVRFELEEDGSAVREFKIHELTPAEYVAREVRREAEQARKVIAAEGEALADSLRARLPAR